MAKDVTRPNIIKTVLECRAAVEGMALFGSYPLLGRAPKGEGQAVLVIPGFTTSDNGTHFLRSYLDKQGYNTFGWELGVNRGIETEQYKKLVKRLKKIAKETEQAVSLVGWNVGGLYARALANDHPKLVRMVITLASPFALPSLSGVSESLSRLYLHYNSAPDGDDDNDYSDLWERTPPMPSTSIYSEGDGVINWRFCIDDENVHTENVRVLGSHLGLTVNPLAYFVIAERLSQNVNRWRSFNDAKRAQPILKTLLSS